MRCRERQKSGVSRRASAQESEGLGEIKEEKTMVCARDGRRYRSTTRRRRTGGGGGENKNRRGGGANIPGSRDTTDTLHGTPDQPTHPYITVFSGTTPSTGMPYDDATMWTWVSLQSSPPMAPKTSNRVTTKARWSAILQGRASTHLGGVTVATRMLAPRLFKRCRTTESMSVDPSSIQRAQRMPASGSIPCVRRVSRRMGTLASHSSRVVSAVDAWRSMMTTRSRVTSSVEESAPSATSQS